MQVNVPHIVFCRIGISRSIDTLQSSLVTYFENVQTAQEEFTFGSCNHQFAMFLVKIFSIHHPIIQREKTMNHFETLSCGNFYLILLH